MTPRDKPCSTCPYRQDCESGVWDRSEYEKLVAYDEDTGDQPLGVFLCHSGDRDSEICRGWLDAIDKGESLALRLACGMGGVDSSIFDLPPSGVPVFSSGQEAYAHGIEDIEAPSDRAERQMRQLEKKIPQRRRGS